MEAYDDWRIKLTRATVMRDADAVNAPGIGVRRSRPLYPELDFWIIALDSICR